MVQHPDLSHFQSIELIKSTFPALLATLKGVVCETSDRHDEEAWLDTIILMSPMWSGYHDN